MKIWLPLSVTVCNTITLSPFLVMLITIHTVDLSTPPFSSWTFSPPMSMFPTLLERQGRSGTPVQKVLSPQDNHSGPIW